MQPFMGLLEVSHMHQHPPLCTSFIVVRCHTIVPKILYSAHVLRFLATHGFLLEHRHFFRPVPSISVTILLPCLLFGNICPIQPFKKIQNNTTCSFSPFSLLYSFHLLRGGGESAGNGGAALILGRHQLFSPSAAAHLVSPQLKWRRSSIHAGVVLIFGALSRRGLDLRWRHRRIRAS
jgi:hypothetical protein